MKPILFNTEMVRAILDGRKTVTRRAIRQEKVTDVLTSPARTGNPDLTDAQFINCLCDAPCCKGDILYVRETWNFIPCIECGDFRAVCGQCAATYEDSESISEGCFVYRADYREPQRIVWRPSIHMPKAVARIFLRVTSVRVECVQDITNEQALAEGVHCLPMNTPISAFSVLWNRTVRATDMEKYGWAANPWVWVIEFERCEKPEEVNDG